MTLAELIAKKRAEVQEALTARAAKQSALIALRSADQLDEAMVAAAVAEREAADGALTAREAELAALEAEERREAEVAKLQARVTPTNTRAPKYDEVTRTGAEERTYRQDQDPSGTMFLSDVMQQFLTRDPGASGRLARHMEQERSERAAAGKPLMSRAGTTANYTGLVVPQYLTDLFAPKARAKRPFADVCRPLPLPATGNVVEIGRLTTGTSAAEQAAEGDAVSETDADDTILEVPVFVVAGSQSLSRKAVERGTGITDVMLQDLYSAYATELDRLLLYRASTGLQANSTAVTYTDASPSGAELYPKVIESQAGVEAALLGFASGTVLSIMHSRRWYWLQNSMVSTWPLIGQMGIAAQQGGVSLAEKYGNGYRGVLPNGSPVIVDNNIATNVGAGTNEDEVYTVDPEECFLWEDPSAPMMIRAEEPQAKKLLIDFVVYGYAAFTAGRMPHARRVTGTGLVTPTFTGV